MVLGKEEKEKLVLDLYYTKQYTYKQIIKELRMSPNQIREIIKRHEEKDNAIANKKKDLSLSSKAYKMFSEGRTNVYVAIKLNIPQTQVSQFRLEYWKLTGQDKLATLYTMIEGRIFSLLKLYRELVIKRGMSIEAIANLVDIALDRLPYMETLLDQATRAAARKQEKVEYLENRIRTLGEEEKKKKVITLPPYYYHYVEDRENSAMKAFSSNSDIRQPSQLPYWPTENYDPWGEYRNKQEESKEKEEIREEFKGDIAE
jgi:DNA-binding transcriptional MerR regulator